MFLGGFNFCVTLVSRCSMGIRLYPVAVNFFRQREKEAEEMT
jgi:hypothetical protein